MKININSSEIIDKRARLEIARVKLKEHFVGIDKIIDDLITNIQIWYLLPELLVRPVIINLWGLTGVGKTDLIRRLVEILDFHDRFAQIELANKEDNSWPNSVYAAIEDLGLNDSKPIVILFDEIQRFNSIDSKGEPVQSNSYRDFWELLSDGKLARKSKDDFDNILYDYKYRKSQPKRDGVDDGMENYNIGYYQALQYKKSLGLSDDIESFVDIKEDEFIKLIKEAKKKKKFLAPIDHSKSLIFISGNLDEAFNVAGHSADADVDADIFHAFSSKVTLMDIKGALMLKFRPEQVARFGNIHLIYPSLAKADFIKLIDKEIKRISDNLKEKTEIEIIIKPNINALIYRNGVFPVQGVRPVFSSISDILEVNLANFVFNALENNQNHIEIDYIEEEKLIRAKIGDNIIDKKFEGRLDIIRANFSLDKTANVSVHEAGHAVIYMLKFGLVPLQLKSRVTSSEIAGFTFPHDIFHTKSTLLDMVKVLLAGGIAEDLCFGEYNASFGRGHDRFEATRYVADYLRRFGFGEFQATYFQDDPAYRLESKITDKVIEDIMQTLHEDTKSILLNNINLLKDLSKKLLESGNLIPSQIQEIAKAHNIETRIETEGYLYIPDYKNKLENK